MESHAKLGNVQHTSNPSLPREDSNKFPSASATHPSVCPRSRDYLQTIFKKINSGENVLSRIPTRLDPNIQFSDDDEEEEETSPQRRPPAEGRTALSAKKDIKTKDPASMKLENPLSHRKPLQDRLPAHNVRENIAAKYHSGISGSCAKIKHPKTVSVPKGSSFSDLKSCLKPSAHIPLHFSKLPNSSHDKGINMFQNAHEKLIPEAANDVITVNDKVYAVLSLLGTGGSCGVYSVIDTENKSRVAIKRVNLKDADPMIKQGYMKEIEYLQKLQNSDRVIKMFDFECRENELLLVLEHGDIDFAKYISNEAKLKRLTPLMIKFFWAQMLEAVADIHKYGIVHSDLKPANFLLVAGNLKLIDFGIATSVPDDMTSTFRETQVGTLNYMSPEAITQMSGDNKHPLFKVGVKSDVWSLGCILYNLVYGVTPFSNIKVLMQKIYAITNPNYNIPFDPLPDLMLLDVLKSCLKRNPKERASVEELLNHPYLAKDILSAAKPPKSNTELDNVLAQMQNLTPKRMRQISQVIQEMTEKANK